MGKTDRSKFLRRLWARAVEGVYLRRLRPGAIAQAREGDYVLGSIKVYIEPRDLWAGAYIAQPNRSTFTNGYAVYVCFFTLVLCISWHKINI